MFCRKITFKNYFFLFHRMFLNVYKKTIKIGAKKMFIRKLFTIFCARGLRSQAPDSLGLKLKPNVSRVLLVNVLNQVPTHFFPLKYFGTYPKKNSCIKGNAPTRLSLSLSRSSLARTRPPLGVGCAVLSRGYGRPSHVSDNRVVTRFSTTSFKHCRMLETFNTIARYVTKFYRNYNIMCVCIKVKEYKNQTESC